MSTYDVPGANPVNRDELHSGCWAQHEDGSLIFVEGAEGGRVVYSIFDMSTTPVTEFRDAMAEGAFKKSFSWNPKDKKSEKWLWKDKTPFPWDRIIQTGGKAGLKHASAEEQLTAAERVRRSREIHRGDPVDVEKIKSRTDRYGEKAIQVLKRIQRAIRSLEPGDDE